MFCSTWEFSNPARERMVGWTLWQGSSVLPLNIKGCYKITTSGRLQTLGIPLDQLLEASPVCLETQGSFYPRLIWFLSHIRMAVVFLFANSANSKAECVSQRYKHTEGTNVAPLTYKKSSSSSCFPFLNSYKVHVVF